MKTIQFVSSLET